MEDITESDDPNAGGLIDEEVAFWRDFVEWWAREKQEPVSSRAWEALARAEEKRAESPARME